MIKPLNDKILIELVKKDKPSGIILPDGLSIGDEIAIVKAIGTDSEIHLRVGDEVVFNPAAALKVEIQGENYIMVTQKGVLAILNYDREGR
jgi:chaperonin GroES